MRTTSNPARRVRAAAGVAALLSASLLAGCSGDEATTDPAPSTAASSSTPAAPTGAPSATPSTPAPAPAATTALGETSAAVRLCPGPAQAAPAACGSAQAGFRTSTVVCSADLPAGVPAGSQVVGTMYLDGRELFSRTVGASGDAVPILAYSFGRLQAPQGRYACRFTAGGRAVANRAKVEGPAGRASQAMACDGRVMVTVGGVKHCPSGTPALRSPGSLGCSAVLTGLHGRKVEASVTGPGGRRATTVLSPRLASEAAVGHLEVPRPGPGFPAGRYTCSFLADGAELAQVPITVS